MIKNAFILMGFSVCGIPFENLGEQGCPERKNFSMFEPAGRVLKFSEDRRRSREEFSLGRPSLGYLAWPRKKGNRGLGRRPTKQSEAIILDE